MAVKVTWSELGGAAIAEEAYDDLHEALKQARYAEFASDRPVEVSVVGDDGTIHLRRMQGEAA
jgi:NAD kinase